MARWVAVVVGFLVLTTGANSGSGFAGSNVASVGPIAFASLGDEDYELHTIDLAGRITPLTEDSPWTAYVGYGGAAWSPDGRSVAVDSYAQLNAVSDEPMLVGYR